MLTKFEFLSSQVRTLVLIGHKNLQEAEAEKLKDEFESHLEKFCYPQTSKMDSNVITPGTLFMDCLSSALQYYICLRLNKDPGWRSIKV